MPVYRSLAEIPASFGPAIATIGNFDGVHIGHQRILAAVTAEARRADARSIALTFDPHPECFLRPDRAPLLITPMGERLRLLAATGLDAVLVMPFAADLASLSARQFVESILLDRLHIRTLHEGSNFRFGHRAGAGVEELRQFGAEFNFTLHVHDAVHVHGMEVSSSAVRALLAAGDIRRARWMLGRPFSIVSAQVRDRGIGTRLLVPTVNLAPYTGQLPGFGVYVTRLSLGGRCFQSVTNVGNRPTMGDASFAVESHILNFEPLDLAENPPLRLEFLHRLRDEIKFPSAELLKEQIFADIARAKRYFRLAG